MCVLYFKKCGELWMIKNPQQYQEILRLKREKEMNKPTFKITAND